MNRTLKGSNAKTWKTKLKLLKSQTNLNHKFWYYFFIYCIYFLKWLFDEYNENKRIWNKVNSMEKYISIDKDHFCFLFDIREMEGIFSCLFITIYLIPLNFKPYPSIWT